eukprot:gb/GFBE01066404.1/.p1 GENE.gb/GFBE01066404.1/~~gb/GFBE01066404.1/.p1  ORF type:complete len:187 (+),score=36.18 gb/GFBE01066404.1/:1-561(+)
MRKCMEFPFNFNWFVPNCVFAGDATDCGQTETKQRFEGPPIRHFVHKNVIHVHRTDDEVMAKVDEWTEYLHQRASALFDEDEVELVLIQVARYTSKHDDPILGPSRKCTYWFGEMAHAQPIIRLESRDRFYCVAKLLGFMFVVEDEPESEERSEMPLRNVVMQCGDQRCVCRMHCKGSPSFTVKQC